MREVEIENNHHLLERLVEAEQTREQVRCGGRKWGGLRALYSFDSHFLFRLGTQA